MINIKQSIEILGILKSNFESFFSFFIPKIHQSNRSIFPWIKSKKSWCGKKQVMSRKGVTPQYPVGNKRGWFNESRAKSAALVVVAAVAPHPQPHSYKMDWGCWWGPLTPTSLLQSPSSKRHIIFFRYDCGVSSLFSRPRWKHALEFFPSKIFRLWWHLWTCALYISAPMPIIFSPKVFCFWVH